MIDIRAFDIRGADRQGRVAAINPKSLLWVGNLEMHFDNCAGYVHSFEVLPGQSLTIAPRILLAAATWLQERGVKSVLIHVAGKNINRKFYRRMGFVDVPKVPGLMATTIEEVLNALARFSKE